MSREKEVEGKVIRDSCVSARRVSLLRSQLQTAIASEVFNYHAAQGFPDLELRSETPGSLERICKSDVDDFLLNGVLNQLTPVMEIQFFHQVGAMRLHRLHGDG